MNHLIVSSENVVQYRNLFLHAIKWYKDSISQGKWWAERYLDTDLSLLPDLDSKITNDKEIEGDVAKLLRTVIKGYRNFVQELKTEPWVNEKAVKDELSQLDRVLSSILDDAC